MRLTRVSGGVLAAGAGCITISCAIRRLRLPHRKSPVRASARARAPSSPSRHITTRPSFCQPSTALEDLVFTVESLTCPETGCPWNQQKSVRDYLQFVCLESDEALLELQTLRLLGPPEAEETDTQRQQRERQRAAVVRAVTSELGDVLYVALVAVSKAGLEFGFEPGHAYTSAVQKIRGRTPYMAEWGDGSVANNLQEAQALWKQRKQRQKKAGGLEVGGEGCSALLERSVTPRAGATARQGLVYTVGSLVFSGRCPWTDTITTGQMLQYLKDECQEAMVELDSLCSSDEEGPPPPGCQSFDRVRRALVSELGDVLFDTLMAIFLAARDHGFDPSEAYSSAVHKIRGRTPYIEAWGDGSVAETPAEAEAMWNHAKKLQKAHALGGECSHGDVQH